MLIGLVQVYTLTADKCHQFPGTKHRKYKDSCPLDLQVQGSSMQFRVNETEHTIKMIVDYYKHFGTCDTFGSVQPLDSKYPKNWGNTSTEMSSFPEPAVTNDLQCWQEGWNPETKKGHRWVSPGGDYEQVALQDATKDGVPVRNTRTINLHDVYADNKHHPNYQFYQIDSSDNTTKIVRVGWWHQRVIPAITYYQEGGFKWQGGPYFLYWVTFKIVYDDDEKHIKWASWCSNGAPARICSDSGCTEMRLFGDCTVAVEKHDYHIDYPAHKEKVENLPDVQFSSMIETESSLYKLFTTMFYSTKDIVEKAAYKGKLFWEATIQTPVGSKPIHPIDDIEVNLYEEEVTYREPIAVYATGRFDQEHVQYLELFDKVNPTVVEEEFNPFEPFAIGFILEAKKSEWGISLDDAEFSLKVQNSSDTVDVSHMATYCTTDNLEECTFDYEVASNYTSDDRLMWLVQMNEDAWSMISARNVVLHLLVKVPLYPKFSAHAESTDDTRKEKVVHRYLTTTTQ